MLKSSPFARKYTASQVVLLDFLAPRLASSRPTLPKYCFVRNNHTNEVKVVKPSVFNGLEQVNDELLTLANSMKEATQNKDILGVWKAYRAIQKVGPRLIYGSQYYGNASSMISGFYSSMNQEKKLSYDERNALEELSYACLAHGYPNGLRQMMVWHLLQGDVESVLRMHERFYSSLVEMESNGLDQSSSSQSRSSPPMSSSSSSSSTGEIEDLSVLCMENMAISEQDITHITVLAIAAFAHKNSFHDALGFVLNKDYLRINSKVANEVANDLYICKYGTSVDREVVKDEELAKLIHKTKNYCFVARLAKLLQRPEVFKAHLKNILSEKESLAKNQISTIVSTLLSGFEGERPWATVSEKKKSSSLLVVIPEKSLAHLLNALIVIGQEDAAQSLWGNMEKFGLNPGVTVWNAILEGYRETRQMKKLEYTWRLMREQRVAFDAISFNARINCLFEHGFRSEALRLFDSFKRNGRNLPESVLVFNTVLSAYLRGSASGFSSSSNLNRAHTLLDSMKTDGPRPDVVTYNSFMSYYGRTGNIRGMATTVDQLTKDGLHPDVFSYTIILSALLQAKVPNATSQLLTIMDQTGVEKNTATYTAIISSQVIQGTREGIQTAWEILQRMEVLPHAQPNIVTYTSFLAGLHRSEELTKSEITNISRDVARKMASHKLHISRGAYHILFKACLENPNPEGLEFFMEFYNNMESASIPFWPDTWFVILKGLLRRNEWKMASDMKQRMIQSGFSPNGRILKLIGEIEMRENDYRINPSRSIL